MGNWEKLDILARDLISNFSVCARRVSFCWQMSDEIEHFY